MAGYQDVIATDCRPSPGEMQMCHHQYSVSCIHLEQGLACVRRQVQLAEVWRRRRGGPDLQGPARRADCAAEHEVLAGLQRQRHRDADTQHRNCR